MYPHPVKGCGGYEGKTVPNKLDWVEGKAEGQSLLKYNIALKFKDFNFKMDFL